MKNISLFFRDSKPFSQLMGLAFFFLIGFILAMGLQLWMPSGFYSPAAIRLSMVVQCVAQLLLFFVPALLFVYIYKSNVPSYLLLNFHGRKWLLAGVAVVVFILLVPINDWIAWWNDQWNLGSLETELRRVSDASKNTVEQMLSLTTFGDFLLQLFVVALIPAVCEELFFRGVLQQLFRQWFGNTHVAIIVTSLVFSLAHGDVYGLVPRFVLGLLLGYLFYCSGSLLVNICAHFFNNGLIVLFYYLYHTGVILYNPSFPIQAPWFVTLICTLAAVALFVLYFAKNNMKNSSNSSI